MDVEGGAQQKQPGGEPDCGRKPAAGEKPRPRPHPPPRPRPPLPGRQGGGGQPPHPPVGPRPPPGAPSDPPPAHPRGGQAKPPPPRPRGGAPRRGAAGWATQPADGREGNKGWNPPPRR